MKKLLILLFTFNIYVCSAQSIWIADNNPNAPTGSNIFSTIQEAIDAATAGDTIYIQPSNTTYGTGTTNIELHFRGIGFNLDKDVPYTSNVTRINLYGAADGSSNPSNSSISGLNFPTSGTGIYLGRNSSGDQNYTLSGVRIYNNYIYNIGYGSGPVPIDDLVIAFNYLINSTFNEGVNNSFFRNNVIDGYIIFYTSGISINANITNNIINGYIYKQAIDDFLVIQNNNFIGNGSSVAFYSQLENATISNNIFYGSTPSIVSAGNSTSANFENNVFQNNISFSTGNNDLPPAGGGVGNTGSGNFVGVDPQFAAATLSTTWQSADDYTTSATEVTNGGTDGTDIGIFGGPYPFSAVNFQLATSPIPTIQSLNISTIINPGQDLEVEVSAKSN